MDFSLENIYHESLKMTIDVLHSNRIAFHFAMPNHRIYTISFARVYPLYVAKAEKKGRTKMEVDEIIRWLTGYTQIRVSL